MEAELASVLADATFVRSPVLARLLDYLVRMTLRGDGHTLKSYSVAIEGLGRSPDLDPQVDTYARVQVARLRKALDGFYASAGASRRQRLTIDSGAYTVRLVPQQPQVRQDRPAATETLQALLPRPGRRRTPLLIFAALLVLGAAVLGIMAWRSHEQAELARWRNFNFPAVTVTVEDNSGGRADPRYADLLRQALLMRMSKYSGIRVLYDSAAKANYAVNLKLYASGDNLLLNSFVVERQNDRLLWSGTDVTLAERADLDLNDDEAVARTAFIVAHGTGLIAANERRMNYDAETPYGCWLRFTGQMLNSHMLNDPVLADCSERWHAALPDRAIPAALYAWSQLDKSIVAVSESGRRRLIDDALRTLEHSRALNQTSPFLPTVATRAYAFAGDDAAVHAAAEQAMALNPYNLEVEGFVGTIMALRNDPAGEPIVDRAIARHPNPPPWYFIAKFAAAMMREDTAAAGKALAQLRQLNHTLPVLPIFAAAYESRMGDKATAQKSWQQAEEMLPILRVNPDIFFERTPLSRPVIARLKQWLGPVLD